MSGGERTKFEGVLVQVRVVELRNSGGVDRRYTRPSVSTRRGEEVGGGRTLLLGIELLVVRARVGVLVIPESGHGGRRGDTEGR